ncbi:MAG: carboxypeptidase regulatory-like domain-containing protein [Planctomycetota bacterium]
MNQYNYSTVIKLCQILIFGFAVFFSYTLFADESKGAIYGYVTDEARELIGGVEIEIKGGSSRVGEIFISRGQGSLLFDGGFFIHGLSSGTYKLEVRKSGFKSAQLEDVKVCENEGTKITIKLTRLEIVTGSIKGRINVGRKTLEDADLFLYVENEKKPLLTTKSDEYGYYYFENIDEGKYIVTVEWDKKEVYRSKTIDIKPKRTESLNISLQPTAIAEQPGSVTGKITDQNGKSVSGAVVTIAEAPEEGTKKARAATNSNGEFELKDLIPGRYTLRATKTRVGQDEKKVTVKSGKTTRTSFRLK